MKKIVLLVALVFSALGFSQDMVSEGVVISKQTMSSPDEQVNMQLAMVGEIITTTYFKKSKSRSEMSSPMAGNSIVILDGDKKQVLAMMDNMMGKKYSLKSIEPNEEDLKNVTVVESTETKTILGYTCKKYDITLIKQGVEVKMELYTSEKLSALSQQTTGLGNKVKGYPMFMEMKVNQMGADMIIKMEVTDIKSEKVSDDKFDMTPLEGYEKLAEM